MSRLIRCEEDPEIFFPRLHNGDDSDVWPKVREQEAQARRLCRECPSQEPCLQLALREDQALTRLGLHTSPGVWGGAKRAMLTLLTKRTRKGLRPIKCNVRGCWNDADLILTVNADEIVCAEHGKDLPWG